MSALECWLGLHPVYVDKWAGERARRVEHLPLPKHLLSLCLGLGPQSERGIPHGSPALSLEFLLQPVILNILSLTTILRSNAVCGQDEGRTWTGLGGGHPTTS